MGKIRYWVMALYVMCLLISACTLPTPEEVKHSVDTQELGKINLTQKDIDEFVEPYVQILEKIKGTDSKDVEISEKDKKSLYEFCKNITEEEFEKMVETARQISGETVENLFDENSDSSGIDELIDVMKEEERD
ncbi:MAG: hypothetical protein J5717_03335 [Lachnospiraceae bacterium]|nr:hypothetical protein [Lachnospiraceae bacterium]